MAKRKRAGSMKATGHIVTIDAIKLALESMTAAEAYCIMDSDNPPEMTPKEFVYSFLLQSAGFNGPGVAKLLYFVMHAETAELPERSPKKRKRTGK